MTNKTRKQKEKEEASIAKDYIGKVEWPVVGSLRVWHVPQIPMKPFHVPVKSVAQAKFVIKVLADYDLFQLKMKVKPDYSSAQGLEVYCLSGWQEWYSRDSYSIDEVLLQESLNNQ